MSSRDLRDEFSELVMQHQMGLYGYIFALVNNLQDTDDLYQQTLLVMWEKIEQLENSHDFLRWACRIAQYEILHHQRSWSRTRRKMIESLGAKMAIEQQRNAEIHQEKLNALESCMQQLPDRDRTLLRECYVNSKTIQMAAQRFKRSAQSVHNSLKRIRQTLLVCIDHKMEAEIS